MGRIARVRVYHRTAVPAGGNAIAAESASGRYLPQRTYRCPPPESKNGLIDVWGGQRPERHRASAGIQHHGGAGVGERGRVALSQLRQRSEGPVKIPRPTAIIG